MARKNKKQKKNKFFRKKAQRQKQQRNPRDSSEGLHDLITGRSVLFQSSTNVHKTRKKKRLDDSREKLTTRRMLSPREEHRVNVIRRTQGLKPINAAYVFDNRKKQGKNRLINNIRRDRIEEICKKRKARKGVLFAEKRAGKGKSGPKKHIHNLTSKVRC